MAPLAPLDPQLTSLFVMKYLPNLSEGAWCWEGGSVMDTPFILNKVVFHRVQILNNFVQSIEIVVV